MDVDVVTETTISRPIAIVAEFAMNPDNAPRWYQNIVSVSWRRGPLGVGAQVDFVANFLGRRLAYTYEIVEFSPSVRMAMRTAQGPFPMETIYTFSSLGADATLVRLQNRGQPKGFTGILAPLMVGAMRSANRKDLELLKAILEAQD